jgi:hypothetical protein
MIAGESLAVHWRKVRTPYGSMPRKIRGQHSRKRMLTEKCHRKHTAGSLRKAQARVKRRGKSSPLAKQFARHEKPHAVQDKTEEGQPARLILGFRRIMANESSPGARRNPGEMNDHPREQSRRQNSAYRHRKYEGRFRKTKAPFAFLTLNGIGALRSRIQDPAVSGSSIVKVLPFPGAVS